MSAALFSQEWAQQWADQLNASEAYHEAAAAWKWPVIIRVDQGPAWFLDLFEGACRSIRPAGPDDSATYEIAASEEEWRAVITGSVSPMLALMKGGLRLEKGSLLKLATHAAAAKAMVEAAMEQSPEQPTLSLGGDGADRSAEPPQPRFKSISTRGIDFESFPMQLYAKAKRLGVWDPADIDFSKDAADWAALQSDERDLLTRLVAMFEAGEEAVTLDLLPLMRAVAADGHLEEEIYLTTFLFEEAKHTEFFRRWLDVVGLSDQDLEPYLTPAHRTMFYEELPNALGRLDTDASPEAQIEAAATYNMIVEGTLAETGYHALYEVLDRRDILPGLREGVGLLQRDESRHVAYGVHLIRRLIASDESLRPVLNARMDALLPIATRMVEEMFAAYDPMPFGLDQDAYVQFATDQFGKRLRRIEGEAELG